MDAHQILQGIHPVDLQNPVAIWTSSYGPRVSASTLFNLMLKSHGSGSHKEQRNLRCVMEFLQIKCSTFAFFCF